MKLDVIDFARRVGMSVDEANKWLEANEAEAENLFEMGRSLGYDQGYNDGAKESYE